MSSVIAEGEPSTVELATPAGLAGVSGVLVSLVDAVVPLAALPAATHGSSSATERRFSRSRVRSDFAVEAHCNGTAPTSIADARFFDSSGAK